MSTASDPGSAPNSAPKMVVTFFTDAFAQTKAEERIPIDRLVDRIGNVSQATKDLLPWLKCARFGNIRSDKNSLRHDANVIVITGVEGDYDAKPVNGAVISLNEAINRVANAGLRAILYTSPSYSEDLQKWRVLCPLSQEYPPEERDRYMARIDGIFDGAFSTESWALSQSYYFGKTGDNPSHRAVLLDGLCIDEADYLDATAIGRPQNPRPDTDRREYPKARPEDITDKRVRGLIASLLAPVSAAADGDKHFTLLRQGRTLGGYLHIIGWSVEQAADALIDALPDSVADWEQARKTAEAALRKGAEQPLELEERQKRHSERQQKDPPPPPPKSHSSPQLNDPRSPSLPGNAISSLIWH